MTPEFTRDEALLSAKWFERFSAVTDKYARLERTHNEFKAEYERMRTALALHETEANLAHRLAIVLECVLLDRKGYFKEGSDLLDEYKASLRAAMAA